MNYGNFSYEVDDVAIATSDPGDGRWVTAIARCTVSNAGSKRAAFGYASDLQPNQTVVDRAVSESVERAMLHLIISGDNAAHRSGFTTTGSAVHPNAASATRLAKAELATYHRFLRAFHSRIMGQELSKYEPKWIHSNNADIRSWMPEDGRVIFCAIKDLSAAPKLVMGARSIPDQAAYTEARDLCLLEMLQPRPWVRQLLANTDERVILGPMDLETAAQRALYWSNIGNGDVEMLWRELCSGESLAQSSPVAGAEKMYRPRGVGVGAESISVRITGVDVQDLYFSRFVDNLLGGKYVTAKFEAINFRRNSKYFIPHPLV